MTEQSEEKKEKYAQWYVDMCVKYARSIGLKEEVVQEVADYIYSSKNNSWLGHDEPEHYVEIVMKRHRHRYLLSNDESYRIANEEKQARYDSFFQKLENSTDSNGRIKIGELLKNAQDEGMLEDD